MPWTAKDATGHDKKAKTPVAKRQWADVANAVLQSTGDEGRAVREANGAIQKRGIAKFKGRASEMRGRKVRAKDA